MLDKIALGPIIVLILHVVATVLGWYEAIFWLDTPMHFLGGVAIGISSYYFIRVVDLETKKFHTTVFVFLSILAMTALAAVAWEVLEYNIDRVFDTVTQPSLRDTMKDLAFGLCGGAIAGALLLTKKKPR